MLSTRGLIVLIAPYQLVKVHENHPNKVDGDFLNNTLTKGLNLCLHNRIIFFFLLTVSSLF